MTGTIITIEGVLVTDITPYRTKLARVRTNLAAIYAGFDPARPNLLLAREAEIVALANDAERLREIVERWDAADLLPGNHAIGRLARQMETSDAARPFYRGPDHRRAA